MSPPSARELPGTVAAGFPMPGTAHLPNLEQPKTFIARLKQFLARV